MAHKVKTGTNTHLYIDEGLRPKKSVSYRVIYGLEADTVILEVDGQRKWDNVDVTRVADGDNGNVAFANGAELEARLLDLLRDPSAELTARIVITVDGSEIQHQVIDGRTVIGIVIAGVTKVDGFNVAADKITFIDGTTVTVNQVVILIFEA